MKGFKQHTKIFGFKTSADSAHGGKVGSAKPSAPPPKAQIVRSHFRAKPAYARGGAMGNATVQRTKPVTDFDKSDGGKGPLAPGYAKGGASCGLMVKKAIAQHVSSPAPKGHKGLRKG
jgi:hypothetical protein